MAAAQLEGFHSGAGIEFAGDGASARSICAGGIEPLYAPPAATAVAAARTWWVGCAPRARAAWIITRQRRILREIVLGIPHRNLMAYLVDEFIDLRAHLQIGMRQAIPHTPGVIQRARAITVESQQRARIEDTHPLPEREVFGRVGKVSLAHTGQIDAVIETAAKELEGIAIEEANAARDYWARRFV